MQRREFLAVVSAMVWTATWLPGCRRRPRRDRVGLALGGGGARGLAHIPMLEVLDELHIRPYRIAGSSIGAVMGLLYAAGLSGADIRALVDQYTGAADESWLASLFDEDAVSWLRFIKPDLGHGGLIDPAPFIRFLHDTTHCSRFQELKRSLAVVAADFWRREQVVFRHGPLGPAVQASMALPGLFPAVEFRGRTLVDGGLVNPVPYDLLLDDCDVVVAIDVLGDRTPQDDEVPGMLESTFNSFQIMQSTIMREKLARQAPQIYIRPSLENVRMLEFYKADEIYRQSRPAKKRLRRALVEMLGSP
jgi:NTE family protein